MGKFIREFKEFAVRGNVMDMAIGLIIGAAFGKIVSSLVADIIMPPIALLTESGNVEGIRWVLREAVIQGEEVIKPEVVMNVGGFLQTVIDFIIIAFVIFLMIKGIMKLKRQKAEEPAPAEPSEEVKLLSDIKELLKKQANS
ncbi:large-conductance mechanosensitive channel protein MscL [Porphyromonas circumdentaria]|uniref:Large-conductance mechanosensitive channel n=1 Tax=Porphyromonas circumdentaria TaxID=29524 RepID=A0A1T4MQL7_9PORP|nr:large-conductance mechanosensitive channel protein MscL [Porphyromonas circumdentaria]MBB6275902.1 large conductance mechanosensitive channel [Porphyromonas circumdentaria]MDO4722650.1 large-conductance mechanosensitive channel protein MscL [Porphyromonas circumdentaria]SJZ69018.1 large conductance mechanosensitive channel [Porphyromonas circumdentaria]